MPRIYLDNAASTPVDPRVLRAMQPYFLNEFGNPGSLHSYGQKAIAAVDASREKLDKLIGTPIFREVLFTGGATEANDLAIRGALNLYKRDHDAKTHKLKIIISSIEHESVMETARAMEKRGVEVSYVPVDKNGIVDVGELERALTKDTVIVSIMYANNEVGSIQPIQKIKKIIDEFKARNGSALYPLFHTDAAQAFQFLNCNISEWGVDMMTLSAHKIYGPKGVGALYVHQHDAPLIKKFPIAPVVFGGGQEFGMRSGTENVPGIVGFAKAAEIAMAVRKEESQRITTLRDRLFKNIKKVFKQVELNGPSNVSERAPHILNIYFPGHDAQDLLVKFDRAGLAASAGSACRSRAVESSYVIEAMGYPKERAASSIRFSLGRTTKSADIATASKIIAKAL
jgi:cysteine desulfurase